MRWLRNLLIYVLIINPGLLFYSWHQRYWQSASLFTTCQCTVVFRREVNLVWLINTMGKCFAITRHVLFNFNSWALPTRIYSQRFWVKLFSSLQNIWVFWTATLQLFKAPNPRKGMLEKITYSRKRHQNRAQENLRADFAALVFFFFFFNLNFSVQN